MPGLPASADLTASTNPTPAAQGDGGEFSKASAAPLTTEDYAAAWDSLKGRFLPRQERLLIEKTLLEEWSVIDLAAAVRAVFAETRDDGPSGFGKVGMISLLDCCAPGIRANPLIAWELVRSRTFGLETGRFRRQWLECMTETDSVQVFSILGELPKGERLSTLSSLAKASCSAQRSRDTHGHLESTLPCLTHRRSRFIPAMSGRQSVLTYRLRSWWNGCWAKPHLPRGRKICISALSLALLDVVEKERFPETSFSSSRSAARRSRRRQSQTRRS